MQCRWKPLSSLFHSFNRRLSSTHAPIQLRPYQELCITSCMDALAEGSTRIGVSLPTGSGKTTVFVELLSRIKPPSTNPNATRSLIIVNNIELARQSAEQVRRMFPDWVVEIEQGAKHQASGLADVTVATYQTLNNEQRLMKFNSDRTKAIIVDEAHHAAAPSYRRILSRFDADIKHPDGDVTDKPQHKVPIIGFTATFSRHDGMALGSVFERIVYHRDFLEMMKEQWLCDIRFTSVKAELNLSKVALNNATGDFSTTSLAAIMNSDAMNNLVVRSWIDRASTRKSTLVFCVNVAHVIELTRTFRSFGVDARYIFAATPALERQQIVSAFKNGEFPVLVNCAILTEGTDIPNVDCIVLARPTRSRNLFAQMVGRGMRLSPATGKSDCSVIDFVDTHTRVGGIVSLPNLFGLDPGELDIEDDTLDSLKERIESEGESMASEGSYAPPISLDELPNPFTVTYTDHGDAFEMADETAGLSAEISSPFAWVNCGDGIWVLECHLRGFIRVEPDDGKSAPEAGEMEVDRTPQQGGPVYKAKYTPPNYANTGKTPYLPSRLLFTGLELASAIRACDNYVTTKIYVKTLPSVLRNNAAWRKLPASPEQRKFLEKRHAANPELGLLNPYSPLTKGEAAVVITQLKHGAAGRYKKKKKAYSKAQEKARKEEQRVNREVVRVGRLPPA